MVPGQGLTCWMPWPGLGVYLFLLLQCLGQSTKHKYTAQIMGLIFFIFQLVEIVLSVYICALSLSLSVSPVSAFYLTLKLEDLPCHYIRVSSWLFTAAWYFMICVTLKWCSQPSTNGHLCSFQSLDTSNDLGSSSYILLYSVVRHVEQ